MKSVFGNIKAGANIYISTFKGARGIFRYLGHELGRIIVEAKDGKLAAADENDVIVVFEV